MFNDADLLALFASTLQDPSAASSSSSLAQTALCQPLGTAIDATALNNLASSLSSAGFAEMVEKEGEYEFDLDIETAQNNRSGSWGSNDSIVTLDAHALDAHAVPSSSFAAAPRNYGFPLASATFDVLATTVDDSSSAPSTAISFTTATPMSLDAKKRPPLVRRSTWAGSDAGSFSAEAFSLNAPTAHTHSPGGESDDFEEKPLSPPVRKASITLSDAKRKRAAASRSKARILRAESLNEASKTKR